MSAPIFEAIETRELNVNDKWSLQGGVAPTATQTGWSVTNKTTDRTINANGAVAEIGDGLATLIDDLIAKGVISA